jgi:hypothetical protein
MSNDPLRRKVQGLESLEDRSLPQTMNLAQARARLAVGEWEARHPKAAIGANALTGVLMGFAMGPEVVGAARSIPQSIGNIAGNIQKIRKGS